MFEIIILPNQIGLWTMHVDRYFSLLYKYVDHFRHSMCHFAIAARWQHFVVLKQKIISASVEK
jgi:hypothetical protein